MKCSASQCTPSKSRRVASGYETLSSSPIRLTNLVRGQHALELQFPHQIAREQPFTTVDLRVDMVAVHAGAGVILRHERRAPALRRDRDRRRPTGTPHAGTASHPIDHLCASCARPRTGLFCLRQQLVQVGSLPKIVVVDVGAPIYGCCKPRRRRRAKFRETVNTEVAHDPRVDARPLASFVGSQAGQHRPCLGAVVD